MRRVLVLRPEPGASATVERARELGLDAVAVPLFEIEPVAWEAPEAARFDGLLLTSANAVRMRRRAARAAARASRSMRSARRRPRLRARPASTLRQPAMSGVDRLLGSIEPELELLHLCGEDRRGAGRARRKRSRRLSSIGPRRSTRPDLSRSARKRRADPFAARGAALRRAGRATAAIDRHRRDQQRCGRGRGAAGKRSKSREQPDRRRAAGPRRAAVQQPAPEMNGTRHRSGMGWGARLLVALVLILVGAAAAVWALGPLPARGAIPRHRSAAAAGHADAQAGRHEPAPQRDPAADCAARPTTQRIAELEQRLARVENATERAEGSAGRADALVVAFAARRAIDRGVALGYLENCSSSASGRSTAQRWRPSSPPRTSRCASTT